MHVPKHPLIDALFTTDLSNFLYEKSLVYVGEKVAIVLSLFMKSIGCIVQRMH